MVSELRAECTRYEACAREMQHAGNKENRERLCRYILESIPEAIQRNREFLQNKSIPSYDKREIAEYLRRLRSIFGSVVAEEAPAAGSGGASALRMTAGELAEKVYRKLQTYCHPGNPPDSAAYEKLVDVLEALEIRDAVIARYSTLVDGEEIEGAFAPISMLAAFEEVAREKELLRF